MNMLEDAFRARVLFFRDPRTATDTSFFLSSEHTLLALFWEMIHPLPPLTITFPMQNVPQFFEPVNVHPTPEQIEHALIPSEPTDINCVICQDDLVHPTVALRNCNHRFHDSCIRTWFETSVRCPTCRNDIRTIPTEDTNDDAEEGGDFDADV